MLFVVAKVMASSPRTALSCDMLLCVWGMAAVEGCEGIGRVVPLALMETICWRGNTNKRTCDELFKHPTNEAAVST